MPTLPMLLALGIAGALGATARFGVAEWVGPRWNGHFPLATLLINLSGAFALGLMMTVGSAPLAGTRLLLGTGFLGGYTTFSTLSFETHALARRGKHHHAWLNALGTLALGALAAGLGIALGRAL
jgi:CrcB protein